MSEQHVFGLSVVGGAPAFPGKESIADHDVFTGLSVVVIPRGTDHLPIGFFVNKSALARDGSFEEIFPEVLALAPSRLRMLRPKLLIRCYLIESIKVLRF